MQAALGVGAYSALNAIDARDATADPEKKLCVPRCTISTAIVICRAELVAAGRSHDRAIAAASARRVRAGCGSTASLRRACSPRVLALPGIVQQGIGSVILHPDPHNEVAEAWSRCRPDMLTIMAVFFAMVLALAFLTIRAALAPLRDVCEALLRIGTRRPVRA